MSTELEKNTIFLINNVHNFLPLLKKITVDVHYLF